MADYTIIADMSKFLLETARHTLFPLLRPEQISREAPGAGDNAALLQIYLYDIKEYGDYVPERKTGSESGMVWNPPIPFILYFVLYFSKHAQTPFDTGAQHQIFGKLMQALHGKRIDPAAIHSGADSADEAVFLTLSKLDIRGKQELWNAFSEPLRPALYLETGPFLLNTGGVKTPRVVAVEQEARQK